MPGVPHCAAVCRLPDVLRQASVVCMDHGWQQQLMAIMGYAAATQGCRRAILAAQFGEPPPQCNGSCDLCAEAAARASRTTQQQQEEREEEEGGQPVQVTAPQQLDLTEHAQLVVKVLQVGHSSNEERTSQQAWCWLLGSKG